MTIFDLSGRVAVITGGNGGIGLGIAQALVLSGCDVSIWARNAEKNKTAAAPFNAMVVRFAGGTVVLSDQAQVGSTLFGSPNLPIVKDWGASTEF